MSKASRRRARAADYKPSKYIDPEGLMLEQVRLWNLVQAECFDVQIIPHTAYENRYNVYENGILFKRSATLAEASYAIRLLASLKGYIAAQRETA
jgi:hypothetical protein